MPRECATIVGRYGVSPLHAMPSTSAGVNAQSASARRAALVASPSDDCSTVPISAVSAAPTIATVGASIIGSRPEARHGDLAFDLVDRLNGEIEWELVRIRIGLDEVGQQPWPLFELHHRDHVRRVEARRGAVVDDVAVEDPPARSEDHVDVVARARRTEWLRREVGRAAAAAPLQSQLAARGALPEVLRLR